MTPEKFCIQFKIQMLQRKQIQLPNLHILKIMRITQTVLMTSQPRWIGSRIYVGHKVVQEMREVLIQQQNGYVPCKNEHWWVFEYFLLHLLQLKKVWIVFSSLNFQTVIFGFYSRQDINKSELNPLNRPKDVSSQCSSCEANHSVL